MSILNINQDGKTKIFTKKYSEISDRYDAQFYWENIDFSNCIKLSKIAKVSGGKRLPKGAEYSKEITKYRYLRIGNINWDGTLNYNDFEYISEELFNALRNYKICKNNLLIAIVGATIGKCSLIDTPNDDIIVLTENCAKIKLKTSNVIPGYLLLMLQTNFVQKQIKLNYIQTTLPKLSLDRVLALYLPQLPPIKKQKYYLDIYNNSFKEKQQKEQKAKELLASIEGYLLEELDINLPRNKEGIENRIFTTNVSDIIGRRFDSDYYYKYYSVLEEAIQSGIYETKQLDLVILYANSGKTPKSSEYSDEKTNYPIIKVGSYKDDLIDLNKVDFTLSYNNSIKAHKNDIFILSAAHQSEYVGRHIKFLNVEPECPTAFVGELICIRVESSKCNPLYLFSILSTEIFKSLINREKTGQTSHVYAKDIKHIMIPMPPIEKQNEIANYINRIRTEAKKMKMQAIDSFDRVKEQVELLMLGGKLYESDKNTD